MRKVANLQDPRDGVQRLILYESPEGVYVFPCTSLEDGSARGDHWFEDVASAEAFCSKAFGIDSKDWTRVPDPSPGCQTDWIAPVRVKGRAEGRPQWGVLERLDPDGVWRTLPTDLPAR